RAIKSRSRPDYQLPSIAERATVLARIRATRQCAPDTIEQDRLGTADRLIDTHDVVSKRLQTIYGCLWHVSLSLELMGHLVEEHARRIDCLLHVHAEINNIGENMGVTARLIAAPHNSIGEMQPPVLHHHRRNDRVQRPLAAIDAIRVAGLKSEAGATVLQKHARFRRTY